MRSQWVPVFGMVVVIAIAAVQVSKLGAQGIPAGMDLSSVSTAELRDPAGRVVLRGLFADVPGDEDERERHAALAASGADANAAGEVEVEVERTAAGALEQEIEVSVRNVAANTTFTLAIDGVDIATLRSDGRGRASLEVETAH